MTTLVGRQGYAIDSRFGFSIAECVAQYEYDAVDVLIEGGKRFKIPIKFFFLNRELDCALKQAVSMQNYTEQFLEKLQGQILNLGRDCDLCRRDGMKPPHFGSVNCKSGSLASGGKKSHCSCDTCF